jgi:AMMECR1 domain-containing protein
LLLPQVATEYGWDPETFLMYACRKAGLHDSAWKDPATTIEIFTAEVFGERD